MLFLIKGQPGHRQQGQRWFFSTARGRKFFPCDLDFLSYVLEILGVSLELAPKYRVEYNLSDATVLFKIYEAALLV